jgi:hypothetical protein
MERVSPEIYVYTTAKHFLNIYDALRIEKVKIELASYDQATGKQTGLVTAWLDLDEMRLLIHLVTFRLFQPVLAAGGRLPRFEKFGGSERDGILESRTLLLEWDPGQQGRFAGYPYRLTIANGPGQRTSTGAMQPKGAPTSKLAMRLPEADLMEILLAVGAYLRARELELLPAKARARQEATRAAQAARRSAPTPPALARPPRAAAPEEGTAPEAPPAASPSTPLAAPSLQRRAATPPAVGGARSANTLPARPARAPAPAPPPTLGGPPEDDLWAGLDVRDAPPAPPASGRPAPRAES